jgi:hypothetical protein
MPTNLIRPIGHFTVDTAPDRPYVLPIGHQSDPTTKPTNSEKETKMNDAAPQTEAQASQTIVIDNLSFSAPAPYVEGDQINVAEAGALNQVFAENIRNNFRRRVADAKEAAKTAAEAAGQTFDGSLSEEAIAKLTSDFAEYAAKYEFAGKRGPRISLDPVTKEAMKIAKDKIKAKMIELGKDMKSLTSDALDSLAKDLLAKKPEYMELAKVRIEQLKSLAADILG